MPPSTDFLDSLIYLDRGYIADLYEVVTGESPKTTITKNQGKKAGAQIPFFSAEVSAQETRSFPISTFAMLSQAMEFLADQPSLNPLDFKPEMKSRCGWVEGQLTAFKARSSVQKSSGEMQILASAGFFMIRASPSVEFALITVPEYFAYGLDALLKMQETVLGGLAIPVRAYIRVIAAQSHTKQWIAVPLFMLEHHADS